MSPTRNWRGCPDAPTLEEAHGVARPHGAERREAGAGLAGASRVLEPHRAEPDNRPPSVGGPEHNDHASAEEGVMATYECVDCLVTHTATAEDIANAQADEAQ